MPAYRTGEHGAFGLKAICVFPGNPAIGKDAHQGAVMLFSRETGELLALMNASEITAFARPRFRQSQLGCLPAKMLSN